MPRQRYVQCPSCGATGRIEQVRYDRNGRVVRRRKRKCPSCNGRKRVPSGWAPSLGGKGVTQAEAMRATGGRNCCSSINPGPHAPNCKKTRLSRCATGILDNMVAMGETLPMTTTTLSRDADGSYHTRDGRWVVRPVVMGDSPRNQGHREWEVEDRLGIVRLSGKRSYTVLPRLADARDLIAAYEAREADILPHNTDEALERDRQSDHPGPRNAAPGLLKVPARFRSWVRLAAQERVNTSPGWNWSGAVWQEAASLVNRMTELSAKTGQAAMPRKRTVFDFCAQHLWLNRESRQRRAEFACEGGPTDGPCTAGRPCRVLAGTDLFVPDVCHGEYPLDWPVNEAATR